MSLVTPTQRNLTSSYLNLPPSPPQQVFTLTSAFFESPFSANNKTKTMPSSSSTPNTSETRLSLEASPSVDVGLQLEKLIAEEQAEQESPNGLDWRVSREWTPLSSRTSTSLTARQQTPAEPEDRLDRLLADMEATSAASALDESSSSSSSLSPGPSRQQLQESSSPSPSECWELARLETRFQPIHTHPHSRPLRPCLKPRSTSISDDASVSDDTHFSPSDSDSASSHSQFSDPPSEALDLPSIPLLLGDERAVRVRFDDDTVEEFLTWSRESYDRKGPMPITKLNLREVIELKLIKEELGISPSSVAISPSSSNSSSGSPSTTTLLPAFDPPVSSTLP